jgi:hypothetical protein
MLFIFSLTVPKGGGSGPTENSAQLTTLLCIYSTPLWGGGNSASVIWGNSIKMGSGKEGGDVEEKREKEEK